MLSLPEPSADERALSETLAAKIRAEILARGPIDFARYMALCLYAPGLGYYSAGKQKFGAAGDFITAPELGDVFARCVARAIAPAVRGGGEVLELGAGSGALAATLIAELDALGAPPARYRILETSADLRERQAHRLAAFGARVEWLDAPPESAWSGALVANEVIDALPVRRFALRDSGLFAQRVGVDARGAFGLVEAPADEALAACVAKLPPLDPPYVSEVLPELPAWIDAVTRSLARGAALFVDYGYVAREYYRADRVDGTLVCHYRHRAHADPLILPGLQDLTAFVDFTALAHAGVAARLELACYASQSRFLLASGLPEILEASATLAPRELAMIAQQVRRLTLPGEMGERFQAMLFTRAMDAGEFACAAVDMSARL